MVMILGVNTLAVLVAAVAAMILGALWYSPLLFGNLWIKLSEFTQKQIDEGKKKSMVVPYILTFIGTLITGFVLSRFISFSNASTFVDGALVGACAWLGFIAPMQFGMILWEGKPLQLYVIHTLHYLVSLVIMGAILAAWM